MLCFTRKKSKEIPGTKQGGKEDKPRTKGGTWYKTKKEQGKPTQRQTREPRKPKINTKRKRENESKDKRSSKVSRTDNTEPAPCPRLTRGRLGGSSFGGGLPPARGHPEGEVINHARQIEADAFQPSGRHSVSKGSAVQIRRLLSWQQSSSGNVRQFISLDVYTTVRVLVRT